MIGIDPDVRLQLIKKYGINPYSTLLMHRDISAFPLASVEGFIGYRNHRALPLVLGEPVCSPKHYRAAIQEFMDHCQAKNKSFLQICCGDAYREAVNGLNLSVVFIGDNFIFDPSTYSPKGRRAKIIRWSSKRAMQSGVSVKEYRSQELPDMALEAAMEALARRWIKKINRFTAHLYSLNLFENRAIKRYFYAEVGGTPVAMIICLPIFGQQG
jgi:lysylphosphatidylglycerol synthetase-like protein (DUF2156 family)